MWFKRLVLIASIAVIAWASSFAEVRWFKAFSYAYKYKTEYGYWTNWTDWIGCDVYIKFELDDDVIVIYSNRRQIYAVYSYDGTSTDGGGGVYSSFKVLDQDRDRGVIRLRIEDNGNSQLYVDFADVMWVYNVRKL